MPRTGPVSLLLTLFLLASGGAARSQAEPDRLQWFEKTWRVRYLDGQLGIVAGRAVVKAQTDPSLAKDCPKAVTVELTHPRTGRAHVLRATAVSWDPRSGTLQLTLTGSSPKRHVNNLPAELQRDAIALPADPGEKLRASLGLIEAAVEVEGHPTETLVVHLRVDSLFQLADGHWTYEGTSTPFADRQRALATPEVAGGVEQWTTVQPLENYANLYQWCIALSHRLLAAHRLAEAVEKLEAELVPASKQAARLHPIVRALTEGDAVLEPFLIALSTRMKHRAMRHSLEKRVGLARVELAKARKAERVRDEEIFVLEKVDEVVAAAGSEARSETAATVLKKLRERLAKSEVELRGALEGRPPAEIEKTVKESAVLDGLRRKIEQTRKLRDGDAELARLHRQVEAAARIVTASVRDLKSLDAGYEGMTVAAMQERWTREFQPAYRKIRDLIASSGALAAVKSIGLPAHEFDLAKLPALGGEIDESNEQRTFRAVEAAVFEVSQLKHLMIARLRVLDPHVRSLFLRLGGLYEYQIRVVKQALAVRMAASRAAASAAAVLAKKDPDAYGPLLKDLEAFNESFKKNQEFMSNSKKFVEYMEKGRAALGYKFGKDFGKKTVEQLDTFAKYLSVANEAPKLLQTYLGVRSDLLHADENPVRALDALEKVLRAVAPDPKRAGASSTGTFAGATAKLLSQYIGYLAWGVGRAAKRMSELSDRIIAADLSVVLSDRRKKPELYLFTKNEVKQAMTRLSPPEEKVNRVTAYLQLRRLMALLGARDVLTIEGTRR